MFILPTLSGVYFKLIEILKYRQYCKILHVLLYLFLERLYRLKTIYVLKGDIVDLQKYRPITLLNQLYKLYTRILTNILEMRLDFYTVEQSAILNTLQDFIIDHSYWEIIENIYWHATTTLNLPSAFNKMKIKRGVRQGDTMSPKLFITVLEYALKRNLNGKE